jgi:hypothetical protein
MIIVIADIYDVLNIEHLKQWFPKWAVLPPWGAVELSRWALIDTRGGRERCYYHRGRCYYHRGALVDK